MAPSLTKVPRKHMMRPRGAKPVNPIGKILDKEHRKEQMAQMAAKLKARRAQGGPSQQKSSSARKCTNPDCPKPNEGLENGTCKACGRVIDDSNIVSEVTFGETSSGAAQVQGSFLGADQGAARMGGPRRQAGHGSGEAREKTVREAKTILQGFGISLDVPEHVINQAHQFYKLASANNFVQGRKINTVAAVCLYAACRSQERCKVMLIDLADIVKEDVFYLGRVFKALCKIPGTPPIQPIYVEDLVYRFAARLEFFEYTNTIAKDAMRIVRRMDLDWMVMGRRPTSICAAAVIIAARMHNYRRLPDEVSYIAKITTATINERLKEFSNTDSASVTIDDFISSDFINIKTQHDPPSFYKKTKEYQEKMEEKKIKARNERKRKRNIDDVDGDEDDAEEPVTPVPAGNNDSPVPYPTPNSSQGVRTPASPPRIDEDGFAIPALPQKELTEEEVRQKAAEKAVIEEARMLDEQGLYSNVDQELDHITATLGDGTPDEPAIIDDDLDAEDVADTFDAESDPLDANIDALLPANLHRKERKGGHGGSSCRPVSEDPNFAYRDQAWKDDEKEIAGEIADAEKDITQAINDPDTELHKDFYEQGKLRVDFIMAKVNERANKKAAIAAGRGMKVSDAIIVGENEFADDPEIDAIVLDTNNPDDVLEIAIRERNWINENKSYLLAKQAKEFREKLAAKNPTKPRKPRAKKPRIGEGQMEDAETPEDAVKDALERRSWKLNYEAFPGMFATEGESRPGSVASGSRATSIEPSERGGSPGYTQFGDLRFPKTREEQEVDEGRDDAGGDDYEGEQEDTFIEDEIDPFADDDRGNDEE